MEQCEDKVTDFEYVDRMCVIMRKHNAYKFSHRDITIELFAKEVNYDDMMGIPGEDILKEKRMFDDPHGDKDREKLMEKMLKDF